MKRSTFTVGKIIGVFEENWVGLSGSDLRPGEWWQLPVTNYDERV
jgi:hypothetical protein